MMKNVIYLFSAVCFSFLLSSCGGDDYPRTMASQGIEPSNLIKAYELANNEVIEIDGTEYQDDPDLDIPTNIFGNELSMVFTSESEVLLLDGADTSFASYTKAGDLFTITDTDEENDIVTIFKANGDEEELRYSGLFAKSQDGVEPYLCGNVDNEGFVCEDLSLLFPTQAEEGAILLIREFDWVFERE